MYSENLVQNKLLVQDLILKFFNDKVVQLLSVSGFSKNYVIDFAVFSSRLLYEFTFSFFYLFIIIVKKVLVIELNPFLETTDGALFSWQHEKDILLGKHGFSFRLTERCCPGAKAMLPQSIRTLMNHKKSSVTI